MKQKRRRSIIATVAFLVFMASVHSQDGQALFQTYCSSCHTIGTGKRVGPDLINILDRRTYEWTISFIRSSQKMIKAGDPDAVAVFVENNKIPMPDQPLSDQQAAMVLDYITLTGNAISAGGSTPGTTLPEPDLLAGTTPENVRQGLLLFTGRQRLANHGPACSSCHKVKDDRVFTSGTLAKELTSSFNTLGSAGLAAMIGNSPFPVMRSTYAKYPISEQEVVDLTAYLKSVSDEQIYQHPRDYSTLFGITGFFFFIIVLAGIQILYFKRKKQAVNHRIFERQAQTVN